MALLRNFQILELSGLHLDQPLVGCGSLTLDGARLASEARFTVAERAFQTAIDRNVDLVVLHSELLSPPSAAGRAPWFLGRGLDRCSQAGIPVVWAEPSHNRWMERFVPTPASVTRMAAGESCRVFTRSGCILVQCGHAAVQSTWQTPDEIQATIGIDTGKSARSDFENCDLLLHMRHALSDRVDDFAASTRDVNTPPLAAIHTLRLDRANSCEILSQSSLGVTRLSCSLNPDLSSASLAEHLGEEVDAAAGRYFSNYPQTQLLLVDLNVLGHGSVWGTLWNQEQRELLIQELNQRTRHPGCHVRTLVPVADSVESTRECPFAPTLAAIWEETTRDGSRPGRSLAEIAPESLGLGEWSKMQSMTPDHSLAVEVRQATLHLLRSAS